MSFWMKKRKRNALRLDDTNTNDAPVASESALDVAPDSIRRIPPMFSRASPMSIDRWTGPKWSTKSGLDDTLQRLVTRGRLKSSTNY